MARPPIKIIGHRGARNRWPENTMAGFKYALDLKVDAIEMDLLATKDRQIVVTHDFRLNNMIVDKLALISENNQTVIADEAPPLVKELTFKELQNYVVGLKAQPKYPQQQVLASGEPIPLLTQVLALIQETKSPIDLILEIKTVPGEPEKSYPPEIITPWVIDLVEQFGLCQQVIIQSFDSRVLKTVQSMGAKIRTSQLLNANYIDPEHLIPVLKSHGISYLSPKWQWTTAEMINVFHQHNIVIYPWTANDQKAWRTLIDIGVDGIITDDPAELGIFLKQDYGQVTK